MRASFFVLSTRSTGCQITQVVAPTYVLSRTVARSLLLYEAQVDLNLIGETCEKQHPRIDCKLRVEAKVSPWLCSSSLA